MAEAFRGLLGGRIREKRAFKSFPRRPPVRSGPGAVLAALPASRACARTLGLPHCRAAWLHPLSRGRAAAWLPPLQPVHDALSITERLRCDARASEPTRRPALPLCRSQRWRAAGEPYSVPACCAALTAACTSLACTATRRRPGARAPAAVSRPWHSQQVPVCAHHVGVLWSAVFIAPSPPCQAGSDGLLTACMWQQGEAKAGTA